MFIYLNANIQTNSKHSCGQWVILIPIIIGLLIVSELENLQYVKNKDKCTIFCLLREMYSTLYASD